MLNEPGGHAYLERGREVFRLREYDPFISDIAALMTGSREILYYVSTDGFDHAYVDAACRALGLGYRLLPVPFPNLSCSKTALLIGKRTRSLKEAESRFKHLAGPYEFGKLLGYPGCCVNFYADSGEQRMSAGKKQSDIIRRIYGNTPDKKAFPFFLNNVYNYFSRPNNAAQIPDISRQRRLFSLNPRIIPMALYVIAWHPCSYHCAKSLKAAREIFSFLTKHVPTFAVKLKEHLARPVIFLDKCDFVSLRGEGKDGKEVRYADVAPPFSLAIDLSKRIKKGNRVVIHHGTISIYAKSGSCEKIRQPKAILLNFRA
jgi:hypothetical protein